MNKLPLAKRAQILGLLVEGTSLRAASRLADCSINTVTKLLVDVGMASAIYQDKTLRNLRCKRVQVDEIWSFVYAKQKNVTEDMNGKAGDIWTWTAIDADTKLVPSWMVYARLIKLYGTPTGKEHERRYSSGDCTGTIRGTVSGDPDEKHVSTSFVERQNLTMRMSIRRFARLTNAFSKKVENHAHAVALHFMHYNFGRIHKTLRVTPAMEARVADHVWSLEEIAALAS